MPHKLPPAILLLAFLSITAASFALVDPPSPQSSPGMFSHVLDFDTVYYVGGPQQARPPEGTIRRGTKVTVLEEAGSYTLVRAENGVVAYVTSSALSPLGEVPGAAITEDVTAAAAGSNRFALELYQQLRGDEGNLFFSPASLATALAMTSAGARGETAEQMTAALHARLDGDRLHDAYGTIGRILNAGGANAPYQLRMANRLWGQNSYSFHPEFLATTRQAYDAELAPLDFAHRPEPSRQTINQWISQQTSGKIPDLIPSGAIDSRTRLLLTNAIYFKGEWNSVFREAATLDAPFHLAPNEPVNVPTMRQKNDYPYLENDQLQAIELPYKGRQLSMVILLPRSVDGLDGLEQSLTPAALDEWLAAMRRREVQLELPRFKMSTEFELKSALAALGMPLPFTDQADFSGIASGEALYLSAVIHKAFVDVNERGTEAAAATGIAVGATSAPVDPPAIFRADHPFLFLIREHRTGAILFLGRLVDPQRQPGT